MNNIVISQTSVTECPHCKGTGKCRNYEVRACEDGRFCVCDFCGRGLPARSCSNAVMAIGVLASFYKGRDLMPDISPSPPTCRVCNGIGKVRI